MWGFEVLNGLHSHSVTQSLSHSVSQLLSCLNHSKIIFQIPGLSFPFETVTFFELVLNSIVSFTSLSSVYFNHEYVSIC